jgi:nitroreductase
MATIHPNEIPVPPAENTPLPAAQPSRETLALLARRRSTPIALMGAPGPSRAEIEALLTLATRVPDHGKLGPWRFLVIEGAARERIGAQFAAIALAKKPDADAALAEMERTRFTRAPVVVAVISTAAPHAKIPEWEQLMSAGAVAYQLVLAAHAMGYGGAWLTEWPAYDEQARAALGLAGDERIVGFVYLGTAKSDPTERVRPPLAPRIAWAD